jgi:hypothetical protein
MGRAILGPGVRLDLDDPTLSAAGQVIADEASSEQDAGDLRRDVAEVGPVQDAQTDLPG